MKRNIIRLIIFIIMFIIVFMLSFACSTSKTAETQVVEAYEEIYKGKETKDNKEILISYFKDQKPLSTAEIKKVLVGHKFIRKEIGTTQYIVEFENEKTCLWYERRNSFIPDVGDENYSIKNNKLFLTTSSYYMYDLGTSNNYILVRNDKNKNKDIMILKSKSNDK